MKKREHFLTQSRGQPYSDTKGKQRHYRQKINYRPIFLTNINVKTSTYTRRQSSATYQKNYTLWRILHHVKSWCKMIIFFLHSINVYYINWLSHVEQCLHSRSKSQFVMDIRLEMIEREKKAHRHPLISPNI